MTASKVLTIAHSQLGTSEYPPFSNYNKYTQWYHDHVDASIDRGAWCDMFVSWVGDQAGETGPVGRFAYCPYHVNWFKAQGRWGNTPHIGAVVFFDWNGDGTADHVGFVKAVNSNGSITTIEGNSGNTNGGIVREVVRSSYIMGYGYPAYTGSTPQPQPKPAPKPVPNPVAVLPKHPALSRVLKLMSPYQTGADVKYVQERLNAYRYKLTPDGVYGPATRAAVISFQRKNGLTPDGEVGHNTFAKL